LRVKNQKERRKGKEEEKWGKDKGRRRELEKISLKCKIYALMYKCVFFRINFCPVEYKGLIW
jgi:hypothetical protein